MWTTFLVFLAGCGGFAAAATSNDKTVEKPDSEKTKDQAKSATAHHIYTVPQPGVHYALEPVGHSAHTSYDSVFPAPVIDDYSNGLPQPFPTYPSLSKKVKKSRGRSKKTAKILAVRKAAASDYGYRPDPYYHKPQTTGATYQEPVHAYADYESSGKVLDYAYDHGGSIPGVPGYDYPTYAYPPHTSFRCGDVGYGFYADTEARCQAWHYCQPDGRHDVFLCPNGTLFSQHVRVCDWWFNVDCEQAPLLYGVNNDLYKEPKKHIIYSLKHGYDDGYDQVPAFYESKQVETSSKKLIPKKKVSIRKKKIVALSHYPEAVASFSVPVVADKKSIKN